MTDQQLQLRGGRNYPNLFGVVQSASRSGFRLLQSELVVLEGRPDGKLIPGFQVLPVYGNAQVLQFWNNTGNTVGIDFVFVDEYGSEMVLDHQDLPDNNPGAWNIYFAGPGQKFLIRITSGDLRTGQGFHCIRTVTELVDLSLSVRTSKVTGSVIDFEPVLGAIDGQRNPVMFNFSPVSFTYVSYVVFDDGVEIPVSSGSMNAGRYETPFVQSLGPNLKGRVRLSGAPTGGYVLVQDAAILLANAVDG